jgi:hypothetical protein
MDFYPSPEGSSDKHMAANLTGCNISWAAADVIQRSRKNAWVCPSSYLELCVYKKRNLVLMKCKVFWIRYIAAGVVEFLDSTRSVRFPITAQGLGNWICSRIIGQWLGVLFGKLCHCEKGLIKIILNSDHKDRTPKFLLIYLTLMIKWVSTAANSRIRKVHGRAVRVEEPQQIIGLSIERQDTTQKQSMVSHP